MNGVPALPEVDTSYAVKLEHLFQNVPIRLDGSKPKLKIRFHFASLSPRYLVHAALILIEGS